MKASNRHTYVIDEAGMIEQVLEKVKTKEAQNRCLNSSKIKFSLHKLLERL